MATTLRRLLAVATALTLAACTGGGSPAPASQAPATQAPASPTGESSAPATSAPSATPAPSFERTKVVLRFQWIPDELQLPYIIADQLGYYDEVGIDFEGQVGNGGTVAVQLVANKDVTFGTTDASNLVIARSKGTPVVAVATQIQDAPAALLTLTESGITDWDKLAGKKIGGSAASSVTAQLNAVLKLKGITNTEFVNMTPPAEQAALLAGQVDAAVAFAGNAVALGRKGNGVELTTLALRDAGLKAPSTTIIAHEDTLRDNPELVQRFVSASLKGLRYALDHPGEAGDIMKKAYPDIDPTIVNEAWMITKEFVTNEVTDANGLGFSDLARWESLQQFLVDGGQVTTPSDMTAAFTNDVVTAIPKDQR